MQLLARERVDFTIAFRRLADSVGDSLTPVRDLFIDRDAFDAWAARWQARLQAQDGFERDATREAMRRANPRIVLRNHLGEIAIRRSREGDHSEVDRLLQSLLAPYDDRPGEDDLAALPPDWASQIEISCSS